VAGTTYYNDGFKTETPAEIYWNLDNTTTTGAGTYYTSSEQTQYIFITMDNTAVLTANPEILDEIFERKIRFVGAPGAAGPPGPITTRFV